MTLKGLRAELGGDTRMVRMMGELLTEPVVLVSMADRRAMQRT